MKKELYELRKFALVLLVTMLMLAIFSGCISDNSDVSVTENATEAASLKKETEKSNNYGESKVVYSDYNAYKDKEFQAALSDNIIDKNFEEDCEKAVADASGDILEVYSNYSKIWKNEMDQSVKLLCTFLDKDEKKRFLNIQDNFEDVLKDNMSFAFDSLNQSSGSSFHSLWLKKYLDRFRERTFEIKYISYCLERENISSTQAIKHKYVSLKFYYKE